METKTINNEHRQRIGKAVNFINDNPARDLSLEKLAGLANYSPFHFQKLFKTIVGETPKRYVLRLKLETAAHALIMFEHKTVTEIAFDHGFSSSAAFARAFRKHFGVSAQEFKTLPEIVRHEMCSRTLRLFDAENYHLEKQTNPPEAGKFFDVEVKKTEAFYGIFTDAPLDDDEAIDAAFKKIARLARVHELLTERTRFVGVIYMHQNIYQTLATVETDCEIPKGLSRKELKPGKFALLKTTGGIRQTFKNLYAFNDRWIPESGYRIADIFGFEILSAAPDSAAYAKIERELYIPIEPAP